MRLVLSEIYIAAIILAFAAGCSPFSASPEPGPDKQASGTWYGAFSGATAGAVTGAQTGAGVGPGAWIGAGLGALFGMASGIGTDLIEEDQFSRLEQERSLRERAWVQEVLAEHYARRLQLHPNRDIYPADWFFDGDEISVKPEGEALIKEIAKMTEKRMPWSRFVLAVYSSASEPSSVYAEHVNRRRAEELALRFVRNGVEPRRILAQATTVSEPVLFDPDDKSGRYRQAIEIIPLDR